MASRTDYSGVPADFTIMDEYTDKLNPRKVEYVTFVFVKAGKIQENHEIHCSQWAHNDPRYYHVDNGGWEWYIVDPDEERHDFVCVEKENPEILIYGRYN